MCDAVPGPQQLSAAVMGCPRCWGHGRARVWPPRPPAPVPIPLGSQCPTISPAGGARALHRGVGVPGGDGERLGGAGPRASLPPGAGFRSSGLTNAAGPAPLQHPPVPPRCCAPCRSGANSGSGNLYTLAQLQTAGRETAQRLKDVAQELVDLSDRIPLVVRAIWGRHSETVVDALKQQQQLAARLIRQWEMAEHRLIAVANSLSVSASGQVRLPALGDGWLVASFVWPLVQGSCSLEGASSHSAPARVRCAEAARGRHPAGGQRAAAQQQQHGVRLPLAHDDAGGAAGGVAGAHAGGAAGGARSPAGAAVELGWLAGCVLRLAPRAGVPASTSAFSISWTATVGS